MNRIPASSSILNEVRKIPIFRGMVACSTDPVKPHPDKLTKTKTRPISPDPCARARSSGVRHCPSKRERTNIMIHPMNGEKIASLVYPKDPMAASAVCSATAVG